MFKNYFNTALRNLSKNKFFATINVFGLAVGMSLSLLFVAMVVFVYQFDNFHPNKERIYRVITHVQDGDRNPSYASAPVGTAQLLRNNFTGIEKVVRIHASLNHEIGYGDDDKIPVTGYFADPEYLTVFNFPLLEGNANTALTKPNSMVITQATAAKIFGDKNPMGELVFIKPFGEVVITGIARNIPKNSNMKFEALVSYSTLISHNGPSFTDDEKHWNEFFNSYTYMLLSENATTVGIEEFLNGIAKEKYKAEDFKASFELQRLDKIVPGPDLSNQIGYGWSYESMVLNGMLPLIILFAACTNYVSLAISQSLKRMKEIGVRKVMGGQKRQIFMQFILESSIIMLIALVMSYFFFEMIRDEVLSIAEETDIVDLDPTMGTYAGFIGFALLVGFVSGIVPAIHFSKIAPVHALKGKEQQKKGGRFTIRKIVITTQFMLSLAFIMVVVIMVQQYRYSVNYDLGFDQQNILNVDLQQTDPQLVKNEFGKLSVAQTVSMSSHALGAGLVPKVYVKQPEKSDSIETCTMSIDENFIANMGLVLLHGRNFSDDATENSRLVIINEVFAKHLSSKDPYGAIDQVIVMPDKKEVRIAGIVKDFHYASLNAVIGNFFFEYDPKLFTYANIRLQSTNVVQAFSEMEAAWKVVGKDKKFESAFLSDQIRDTYGFYFILVKLWGFLGLLAITVACLGLLGTVVFTIRNRVKEVSIRKVMGASSESLVYLLSRDFIIIMVIASIITIPCVYFLMEWLLQKEQHYNAPIGAAEIIISLAIVLFFGMITVLSQTLKAANTNPVDNLKVE